LLLTLLVGKIDPPTPELNPFCFQMYAILCQIFFWSGKRRTDFKLHYRYRRLKVAQKEYIRFVHQSY